ncbi:glutathione S-transferase family protein [Paraglaciecola hydrolytica]|uniref:Glutathione S-transferase n=1 Tax=Paraglaciecola hydrolytica TaxID=1799789 RepID=A0A136A5E5_9ALTE|nr:glutathione S-transferase family protein [Paraglaciecola hydrolytica]KXI30472.1 hypothetical protein AX660_10945 [Paraglaciecola hydrolytica]
MQLLSSNFSPYSTRVRIQIRKKDLPIDIIAPTEPPLRTAEFAAKYPLAKIPVLILDEGGSISESWAIMEYLEARFPEISLRPKDPLGIAHINMLARYADMHLSPVLFPMFVSLLMGGVIDVDKELAAINKELAKGEKLLNSLPAFSERKLNIGDIALATNLLFAIETPKLFGCANILQNYPGLASWWHWVNEDVCVKQGMEEMRTALAIFMANKK